MNDPAGDIPVDSSQIINMFSGKIPPKNARYPLKKNEFVI